MWFIYALLAGLFLAIEMLLWRHILKREHNYSTFILLFQFLPLVFYVPLIAFGERLSLPTENIGWILALAAGGAWTLNQILSAKSYRTTEVSVREPLYRTKLIWIPLLALLFLAEQPTLEKIAGMLLVLAGAFTVAYSGGKFKGEGVKLVLASAFFASVALVLDKAALSHFSPTFYAALMFAFSGFGVLLSRIGRKKLPGEKRAFFVKHWKVLMVASLLEALSFWMQIKALSEGEAGAVVPVLEMSVVFAAAGGMIFLGECGGLKRKIAGIALAVAGALLLKP
ncbi:EamA family transporter [Candidatus Micrarchaeota archaeon]|nr:EamA family transporter [Candidatus Micrarchaeota archaeon]